MSDELDDLRDLWSRLEEPGDDTADATADDVVAWMRSAWAAVEPPVAAPATWRRLAGVAAIILFALAVVLPWSWRTDDGVAVERSSRETPGDGFVAEPRVRMNEDGAMSLQSGPVRLILVQVETVQLDQGEDS